MKRDLLLIVLTACVVVLLSRVVLAQAPSPSFIYANGPISSCPPLPIPNGGALVCVGSDHVGYAAKGALTYLNLDQPPAVIPTGFVKTVQGKPPDASGNVQLSGNTTSTTTIN